MKDKHSPKFPVALTWEDASCQNIITFYSLGSEGMGLASSGLGLPLHHSCAAHKLYGPVTLLPTDLEAYQPVHPTALFWCQPMPTTHSSSSNRAG